MITRICYIDRLPSFNQYISGNISAFKFPHLLNSHSFATPILTGYPVPRIAFIKEETRTCIEFLMTADGARESSYKISAI